MLITIAAAVMVMAAYFLLLYGGVGFIQDKRFFGSAHKDVLAVIPDKKPERFRCLGKGAAKAVRSAAKLEYQKGQSRLPLNCVKDHVLHKLSDQIISASDD